MPTPTRRRFWLATLLLGHVLAPVVATSSLAEEPPLVAGAADLKFALTEAVAAFEARTSRRLKLAFGSSGNFARQIRQGAPIQLFLSADEQYVLDLARDGLARDEGALYAIGRIVLVIPPGSPLALDGTLTDLGRALEDGRLRRFAIANPQHAPYGRRAEEALRHRGLWGAIEPKLVFGENVSQATQFALSGNTQGGIVAYSLALAPEIAARAPHVLIPAEWHEPLRQRMALMRGAGPVAERLYRFLREPEARAIFRRYGFVLPGEAS